MASRKSVFRSSAAAAWAAILRVSLVVVVPHLMWMGPSRWMSQSNMTNDAIIVATSQMVVSSMSPM